ANAVKVFSDSSEFVPLEKAIDAFERAAKDYATLRDKKLSGDAPFLRNTAAVDSINRELRSVGFAFTTAEGLFFARWERNMLVLSDPDNGYADVELPELEIASRRKDSAE